MCFEPRPALHSFLVLSYPGYFLRAFIVLEAKVLSMSIGLSWVCSGLCLVYNDACLWWIPDWDKE